MLEIDRRPSPFTMTIMSVAAPPSRRAEFDLRGTATRSLSRQRVTGSPPT